LRDGGRDATPKLPVRRARVNGVSVRIDRAWSRVPQSAALKVHWRRRPELVLSPLVLVAFVALWDAAVVALDLPAFVVPRPLAVWQSLVRGFTEGIYLESLGWTAGATILGFLAAAVAATVIGAVLVQWQLVERTMAPYVVAFQCFPKIAIAPLLVLWLGYGIQSKVVVAAITAFFPVLVNVMVGLRTVEREKLELMESLRASRWQIFREVRFPNALPFFFAGLHVAMIFAMLGAIVGEFVGSERGLGVLIVNLDHSMDVAGVFSVLTLLVLLGLGLHFVMQHLRRRIVFWAEPDSRVES
jgi:NitT/TauT family transport system permease protein